MPIISGRGRYKQEDPKSKVIFGYTASWRSVWDTLDPVLKQNKMKQTKINEPQKRKKKKRRKRERGYSYSCMSSASTT